MEFTTITPRDLGEVSQRDVTEQYPAYLQGEKLEPPAKPDLSRRARRVRHVRVDQHLTTVKGEWL